MEKLYQVFISSTYTDLKKERQAVLDGVLKAGFFPVGMEQFVATSDEKFEHIKKLIDKTDYYVLIIGNRYGSLTKEGISFTEKEFDYAISKEIPVYAFIHSAPDTLPVEKSEKTSKARRELVRFRDKVKKGRMVSLLAWESPAALAGEIVAALSIAVQNSPRPGWVRMPGTNVFHFTGTPSIISNPTEIESAKVHIINNLDKSKTLFTKSRNILLIGNGCNLYYSLPTTYSSFLNTFNFLCNNPIDQFYTIADVFGNSSLQHKDYHIKKFFGIYGQQYCTILLHQEELKQVIEMAKQNSWLNYFTEILNKNGGWIDFEKEISLVLSRLATFFTSIQSNGENSAIVLEKYKIDSALKTILRRFQIVTFGGIQPIEKQIDGQRVIIDALIVHFGPYSNLSSDRSRLFSSILGDLERSLGDFKVIFSYYLRQFIDAVLPQLVGANYIQQNRLFADADVIITYNYTHLFEILNCNQKNIGVYHINGEVSNDTKIVLGIEDGKFEEPAEIKRKFLPFKQYYQRAVFQTDKGYMKFIHQAKMGDISYRLVVFGSTLDSSNKDEIKKLFLIAESISIYHYSRSDQEEIIKNLISIFGSEGYERLRYEKNLEFYGYSSISHD